MPKHAYSVKEAAEQMSMSRATVYELMRRGNLAYVMVGRHRIVRAVSIEKFLEENETATSGEGGCIMSKAKKCHTCGKLLAGKNYHRMYDEKLKRVVDVCADGHSCQRPLLKIKQPDLKEGA